MVTVGASVSNVVLQAEDDWGDTGLANAINVVNPPALTGMQSGGYLLMLWPVRQAYLEPGFVLETATSLNATNWVQVATPPILIGDQYLESLPMTDASRFFRLRYAGQ